MTLKQIFWKKGTLQDLEMNPDECVRIADEYAIGFGEFMIFLYKEKMLYSIHSTKELLEIYKKEKGL